VDAQQGRRFVASLAKNPLSVANGFGMMRLASQKEFEKVPESGRHNPHEVSKKHRSKHTASSQQRRF
jgi:hypothetical protein